MATVEWYIAERIVSNDGWYDLHDKEAPDNPRAIVVLRYWNAEYKKENYAICWSRQDLIRYLGSPNVVKIRLLWVDLEELAEIDALMQAVGENPAILKEPERGP